MRSSLHIGALLFVSIALLVMTSRAGANAAEDQFYVPPAPLRTATPGTIIRVRTLTGAAALPSASRNFLVLYHSTDPNGRDIGVSGAIAIPSGAPPAGGWPLITWTHGTTGMAPQCAPSRDTLSGSEHRRYLSVVEELLDSYVRHGYAVVATDYEGLGTPGTQAYLVGDGEARGALDIMRAARRINPDIGIRYLVMGHSQGGQADLFTAAAGANYAPEFVLVGNVAIAPASHVGELVHAATVASSPSPFMPFIAYIAWSYGAYYREVKVNDIFVPRAIEHMRDIQQSCIDSALSSGYWAEANPSRQFLPSADLAPLLKAIALNEPGTLKITAPTLLIQGTADKTVPPDATDVLDRDLCKNGVSVLYKPYPEATHDGVLTASIADTEAWVAARFAGTVALSNCDARPRVRAGSGAQLEQQ